MMNIGLAKKNLQYDEKTAQRAYAACVEELVQKRYSITEEISIIRQKDEKPEEFSKYYEYVEQCKKTAKQKLGMKEGI